MSILENSSNYVETPNVTAAYSRPVAFPLRAMNQINSQSIILN